MYQLVRDGVVVCEWTLGYTQVISIVSGVDGSSRN